MESKCNGKYNYLPILKNNVLRSYAVAGYGVANLYKATIFVS